MRLIIMPIQKAQTQMVRPEPGPKITLCINRSCVLDYSDAHGNGGEQSIEMWWELKSKLNDKIHCRQEHISIDVEDIPNLFPNFPEIKNLLFLFLFYFFIFFCLFAISWAAATAYEGSQARGPIGAIATGLHQSHSNSGSEPCLRPTAQLTAMPDP